MGSKGDDNIFCTVCGDSFIVNKSSMNCNFCQRKYHPHCLKFKDSLQKAINECENLYWFCDICKPVVNEKLASNLPTTPISPKLIESIETIVTNVVGKKLQELETLYGNLSQSVIEHYTEGMSQITLLKETNIDMIKMLSGHRPSLQPGGCQATEANHSSNQRAMLLGSKRVDIHRANVADTSDVSLQAQKSLESTQDPSVLRAPSASTGKERAANSSKMPKPTLKKGSGGSSSTLKAAPKGRNWVWVGNLAKSTTPDQIVSHLLKLRPQTDFLAFDLKSKSLKKSFKVGSGDLSIDDLQSPDLWPDGVLIRPFRTLQ